MPYEHDVFLSHNSKDKPAVVVIAEKLQQKYGLRCWLDKWNLVPGETLPRTYTREELLGYLEYCRQKCQETIVSMSGEQAKRMCRFAWGELPFAELQLYNLRHVQEHGAQLRMFIGQQAGKDTGWVPQAKE